MAYCKYPKRLQHGNYENVHENLAFPNNGHNDELQFLPGREEEIIENFLKKCIISKFLNFLQNEKFR